MYPIMLKLFIESPKAYYTLFYGHNNLQLNLNSLFLFHVILPDHSVLIKLLKQVQLFDDKYQIQSTSYLIKSATCA